MDWRTPIRKMVNREDHLGAVRLALLRVIDPVEWYVRKNGGGTTAPSPPTTNGGCGVDRIRAA